MRFTFFLTLLLLSFSISVTCFVDAKDNFLNKHVIHATDTKRIDSDSKVRHLRGRHKIKEERMGVNAAAASELLSSTSSVSMPSRPASKREKALLALVGLVLTSAIVYTGVST
ncbi:Putative RxLR effector [Phytophthora palmivora]|uniref:RxLR effector n=1 Tax=Phytophthora palmivora TaxID=4796 RepID=A0A2P4YUT9_9STRA|nr:Putative RxLR effector [Phytophthora palmivora]